MLVNGVVTPLQGFTFTNTQSTTNDNMGWVTRSFTFTATSVTTTLEFLSTTHNGTEPNSPYGPALDNVSVVGIPEPALMYLLVAGLAGLVVTRRRMSA